MKIIRASILDGSVSEMEIPLTEAQYEAGCKAHVEGTYIQDAFPTLNADQREFLMTGITPEQWNRVFGDA